MNDYIIRKKYCVEYAHQLNGAYSQDCSQTIHGHSGIIEVFLRTEKLDKTDMVIDFGELDSIIVSYINEFDHSLIVPSTFHEAYLECLSLYNTKLKIIDANPTAEYLASFIYWDLKEIMRITSKLDLEIQLDKVRFHETQTGYAEFSE